MNILIFSLHKNRVNLKLSPKNHLAGVHLIIEAHDDRISVTSPPTVFIITMPKVSEKV